MQAVFSPFTAFFSRNAKPESLAHRTRPHSLHRYLPSDPTPRTQRPDLCKQQRFEDVSEGFRRGTDQLQQGRNFQQELLPVLQGELCRSSTTC